MLPTTMMGSRWLYRTMPLAIATAFVACTSEDAPPVDDAADDGTDEGSTSAPAETTAPAESSSTGPEIPDDAPTYYEDVLPLVAQHCQSCHEAEGIGPFDISDYETAKLLAPAIAGHTAARSMPPFVADNTGACNTFANARWLSDDEIDLLQRWSDAGAPEGDPSTPRPVPPVPATLKGDDVTVFSSPDAYVAVPDEVGSVDDYQCFRIDLGISDAPRYLIGHEVLPSDPTVTHHLVAFSVDPEATTPLGGTNGSLMDSLDNASPDQEGWDCYGAAGNGVLVDGTPVTWAPGGGAFNFPEGTGIRLDPGYELVLQVHYNLTAGQGGGAVDVHLSMADEVEREAVNALDDKFLTTIFNGTAVDIPPGMDSWVWGWQSLVRDFDDTIGGWGQVQILGLLPHMHTLGHRMQVTFKTGPEQTEVCGLYVDRWNFNWQQAFMYETPIILSPSDKIEVTCDWDTSGKDTPTTPGLGTSNEMCLLGIYAAEAP
ncbi:MAG TPA: hypothetical protein VG755_19890 [Nannocystaceae bacterium]|nr:hypothetical protein [Nannocystaceae bacterium]